MRVKKNELKEKTKLNCKYIMILETKSGQKVKKKKKKKEKRNIFFTKMNQLKSHGEKRYF